MASLSPTLFSLFLFLSSTLSLSQTQTQSHPSKSTFIVHLSQSHKPNTFTSTHDWHSSILRSLSSSATLLYSYRLSVTGFSAQLTGRNAAVLRRHPAVISVVPDEVRHLHTTHTPHFLNLADSYGLWPNSDYASDIIIGVLDTGIWPEVRSFSDSGYDPVPSSWKGTCEVGSDFPASSCNRKLIGARVFYKGYEARHGAINETIESKSPRDTQGHGTHTASTAAGSVVSGAGFYQYATGDSGGMATKARIAAYKICWKQGCFDSDILAAMDQAIEDGVDMISLSVGARGSAPAYDAESIAIGAFRAVQNGILVSCSAGNSGPGAFTAVNIAPWILTVGASTIDREFPADVVLGDGRRFSGVSLYYGEWLNNTQLPLVYGGDSGSKLCKEGELDASKVAGKMVICDRGENARVAKGNAVKLAGGVAMIMANTADSGEELLADSHLIPATMVGQIAGDKIKSYVSSNSNPTATINFLGTVIATSPPAPRVASFSSRGPNNRSPQILKPDVIAPGVNILAAWTGAAGPTDLDIDPRRVEFNIISGTSMSCPHVTGLAALLKNAHPTWSPAAVKSALMTTAYNLDNSGSNFTDLATGQQSYPFVHGSGHVDPNKALDPGLVYDIESSDYIAFLCASGYDSNRIAVFLKEASAVNCTAQKFSNPGDLNYPSFSAVLEDRKYVVTYRRTLKNVGERSNVVYKVSVNAPANVDVSVSPKKLVFNAKNQTQSYKISFRSRVEASESILDSASFGSIEWSDGSHRVRSPVAVRWVQATQQQLIASV